ncbi:hypothetical protein C8Q76DRAFT_756345 [Earliella scabrosa]|nr:hypothetical protein C8Q76DRAFT_756345 [Earliella scabrosa]
MNTWSFSSALNRAPWASCFTSINRRSGFAGDRKYYAMSADYIMSHLQTAGVEIKTGSLDYLQTTKYFTVIALTLAILETLSTFPDEVTYMWSSRLSPITIIYFINKYAVFLDAGLAVNTAVSTPRPELCNAQFQTLAYCTVIGTMVSEAILLTRTIALWKFNTYVKAFLISVYIEIATFAIYCAWITLTWIEYPSKDVLRIIGCVPSNQDRDIWPAYVGLIILETVIIMLTILRRLLDSIEPDYPRVDHHVTPTLRRCFAGYMESVLVKTLYRDGIHFYGIVLGVTTANLLVMLSGPEGLTSAMQIFLRVIHSALCTRVILNLRKAATDTTDLVAWDSCVGCGAEQDDENKKSTIVFARDPAEV